MLDGATGVALEGGGGSTATTTGPVGALEGDTGGSGVEDLEGGTALAVSGALTAWRAARPATTIATTVNAMPPASAKRRPRSVRFLPDRGDALVFHDGMVS